MKTSAHCELALNTAVKEKIDNKSFFIFFLVS